MSSDPTPMFSTQCIRASNWARTKPTAVPDVPKPIEDAILRCMDAEPYRRFASITELRNAMESWLRRRVPNKTAVAVIVLASWLAGLLGTWIGLRGADTKAAAASPPEIPRSGGFMPASPRPSRTACTFSTTVCRGTPWIVLTALSSVIPTQPFITIAASHCIN